MYDYYLGGKDNFEADRIAAEKVLALVPGLRRAAVENRRFLRRVVRFLAAEAGVSQFLDIGVGLPTQGAVHEVAREVNPDVRVVYVDYDPVVVSHGQALLAVSDLSIMVHGDLRRPGDLLAKPEIRAHLDFSRPVAIGLFAIVHFLPDADDPAGKVMPSPSPRASAELSGVAVTSASNAWAVGSTSNSHHGSFQTLILRWNGTAWK